MPTDYTEIELSALTGGCAEDKYSSFALEVLSICEHDAVLSRQTIVLDVLLDVVCEFPVFRFRLTHEAPPIVSDLPDCCVLHARELAQLSVPDVEIVLDDALLRVCKWIGSCHSEMSFSCRISTCESSTFAPLRFTR